MSYESPIELIMGQMNMFLEGEICKSVQNVGVNVNKEELLKALQYDRKQYQNGYNDRDTEIIRCKNCKYFDRFDGVFPWCSKWNNGSITDPEGYCFMAEREES